MGPNGVALMPRRRSADPTRSIRITLQASVLDGIHELLAAHESRSAWINTACKRFLAAHDGQLPPLTVRDATDKQLLAALYGRGAITKGLYDQLTLDSDS